MKMTATAKALKIREDWDACETNEDGGQTWEQALAEWGNWDAVSVCPSGILHGTGDSGWFFVTEEELSEWISELEIQGRACLAPEETE